MRSTVRATFDDQPPRFAQIPKRTGGVRRITVLGAADDAAYRRVVTRLAATIEKALGPEVLANRIASRPALTLRPWKPSWRGFLRARGDVARRGRVLLRADVKECYPSIGPRTVERTLDRLGAERVDVRELTRLLERFQELGVVGLPVGPEPSAVLANAALISVDDAFRRARCPHVRWVDDVWAAVGGIERVEGILERLRGALAPLGLSLNEEKTIVLETREAGVCLGAEMPSGWVGH